MPTTPIEVLKMLKSKIDESRLNKCNYAIETSDIEAIDRVLNMDAVSNRFVYRLHKRGECRTYEIGKNDNPRTSPQEWCDSRVCEGFWGDEEICKRVVSLLNVVYS